MGCSYAYALGGASAIFTGVNTSRVLGGLAGITSGIHAEFLQAYFQNLAIHVITPAIDSRRKKALQRIKAKQTKSITEYNMQEAIQDVIMYHNQCTMNAALEEAGQSIQLAQNPGLAQALSTIRRSRRLSDELEGEKELRTSDFPTSVLSKIKNSVEFQNSSIDKRISLLEENIKDEVFLKEITTIKPAVKESAAATTNDLNSKLEAAKLASNNLLTASSNFENATEELEIVRLEGTLKLRTAQAEAISQQIKLIFSAYEDTINAKMKLLDKAEKNYRERLKNRVEGLTTDKSKKFADDFAKQFDIDESQTQIEKLQSAKDKIEKGTPSDLGKIGNILKSIP